MKTFLVIPCLHVLSSRLQYMLLLPHPGEEMVSFRSLLASMSKSRQTAGSRIQELGSLRFCKFLSGSSTVEQLRKWALGSVCLNSNL